MPPLTAKGGPCPVTPNRNVYTPCLYGHLSRCFPCGSLRPGISRRSTARQLFLCQGSRPGGLRLIPSYLAFGHGTGQAQGHERGLPKFLHSARRKRAGQAGGMITLGRSDIEITPQLHGRFFASLRLSVLSVRPSCGCLDSFRTDTGTSYNPYRGIA